MSKMKKVLLLATAFVLVAAIAVGATFAYLTDRDSKVNTFTVGNVSIKLNEEFQQDAELMPGVRIEKEATITNTGDNDAWVWMTVAVPAALDDENAELGSANVLHWNMPGCFWNGYHDDAKYIESGIQDGYLPEGSTGVAAEDSWINDNVASKANIDGIEYNVYTFKYVGKVTPGETTNIGLSKVFMDENVDIDPEGQWYVVENGTATKINWNSNTDGAPKVIVSAYAMQADGFDTVEDAYAAYQTQWGDNGAEYSEPPAKVKVEGGDKAAVLAAIDAAAEGDIIVLTEDITVAGYNASEKLVIEKAITLDLNGKTLTTESGWGGIDLKNGASIKNGTINHTGNTAAIKAFDVGSIENVTINVTETAGKTKGGIVVQSGVSSVGSIKNVTINGATNGIECYNNSAERAIGSMSNVTINALQNGIYLNGGGVLGTMSNVTITAGDTGIRGDLKGVYSIDLDLVNCAVSGTKYGVDLWDETPSNPGTVTMNHTGSTFTGGTYDIKITLNEEVACTYQNEDQTSPVEIYIQD